MGRSLGRPIVHRPPSWKPLRMTETATSDHLSSPGGSSGSSRSCSSVSVITFFLMHAVPGGPWDSEKRLPAVVQARLNAEVRPRQAAPRAVHPVGRRPSSRAISGRRIGSRTGASMTSSATGSATPSSSASWPSCSPSLVGIPLGIIAALGHNRWPDYLSTCISIMGIATPSFVLGILLIVRLRVEPRMVPDRRLEGTRDVGAPDDRAWPASRSP